MLLGSCLDGHVLFGDAHHLGESGLHCGDIILDFWFLETNGAVNIGNLVTRLANNLADTCKQNLGINALELVAIVGKPITNVPFARRAEQCVADGVNQAVGVRMSHRALVMLYLYATKPKRNPIRQLVDIVSKTSFYLHFFININYHQLYHKLPSIFFRK